MHAMTLNSKRKKQSILVRYYRENFGPFYFSVIFIEICEGCAKQTKNVKREKKSAMARRLKSKQLAVQCAFCSRFHSITHTLPTNSRSSCTANKNNLLLTLARRCCYSMPPSSSFCWLCRIVFSNSRIVCFQF